MAITMDYQYVVNHNGSQYVVNCNKQYKTMEEILKELMNEKCKAMLNNKSRCFKKKACDGQCGYFQNALCKLNTVAYIDMCNIKNQLDNE